MPSFVLQPAAPLTKACGQTNHGQGVGFKVHNIVLDKKMLSKIAMQVQSAIFFLAPIVISYRAEGRQGLDTTPRMPTFATNMTCRELGCE